MVKGSGSGVRGWGPGLRVPCLRLGLLGLGLEVRVISYRVRVRVRFNDNVPSSPFSLSISLRLPDGQHSPRVTCESGCCAGPLFFVPQSWALREE